jgi:hypothetical protein
MRVEGYAHFGGRHGESASIRNLLAYAGVRDPHRGEPLTEAACFGIAGGIGAGYSFCPSLPRYGTGSGVSVVGRHRIYATGAAWYRGFFDRIGAKVRITETAAEGKAYRNLLAELDAGRPTVVWCGRSALPFLGKPMDSANCFMHSFVVFGVDETKEIAYGADRAAGPVTLGLEELAEARRAVCSHRNRTLTLDPPPRLTRSTVKSAMLAGLQACADELLRGKMKTFSLPGLEIWARMIANASNKDGWLEVFREHLMFAALRDVFDSIETVGTGGGLYRPMFAEFLEEAAAVTGRKALGELAETYRELGGQWSALADAAMPDSTPAFKKTKTLLRKRNRLYETKGEKARRQIDEASRQLQRIEAGADRTFPLGPDETRELLEGLRGQILALHEAETAAARRLDKAVA